MIKVNHLNKWYKDRQVLKDVDLEFSRYGLYVIYGPSGCGKTTLLNCLAGLLSYKGNIQVDSSSLEELNDDELSSLRLSHYGFIFQDFKLYENETVMDNVIFPLETLTNLSKERKIRKCEDLLNIVGLSKSYYSLNVNVLSGGEKQRVAIARSLANDPKIVLADEPTGALDRKNAHEIMKILETISLSSLVIVVSHDKELTEEYADTIIEMEEGRIKKVNIQEHHHHEYYLPVIKNGLTNHKPKISKHFLFRHTWHVMKEKKIRTFICNSITSLGLIGVGLSISLSSCISSNIKKAYSELIDKDSVIVSLKNKNESIYGLYAGNLYEANEIKNTYHDYIYDIGVNYYCNFEEFFIDRNNIALANSTYYSPFNEISARHINEFSWLDLNTNKVYPDKITSLEDDEIVLGMDITFLKNLCFELKIPRTVDSLSDYLGKNDLYLYFDFANNSWQYSDQQIVRLKGFILENDNKIYHYNHRWNEYMFEERMRFPTNDSLLSKDNEPWVMKKMYYFEMTSHVDDFLYKSENDQKLQDYIFELANETYYPWMLYDKSPHEITRLLFFINNIKNIPTFLSPYFIKSSNNINNPILGNAGGYSIFSSSLMMGFSKMMFFSFDISLLTETIETYSTLNFENNQSSDTSKGVLMGHYSKSMSNGVGFSPIDINLDSLDDVYISSCLSEQLNNTLDSNNKLYVSVTTKEIGLSSGKVIRDFQTVELNVKGIIESDQLLIYQNSLWTKLFFQTRIGVSCFDLQTTDLCFPIKNKNKIDQTITEMKRAFPQYEIVNPLNDINESVDEVCFYLSIALMIFSSMATIISILLLTISNYLHVIEGQKEIALARCIGVNKKESKKFLYFHSILTCGISLFLSFIEIILVSFITNIEISSLLSSSASFTFNPLSFLIMSVLAVIISLFSCLFIAHKVGNINPLQALKA